MEDGEGVEGNPGGDEESAHWGGSDEGSEGEGDAGYGQEGGDSGDQDQGAGGGVDPDQPPDIEIPPVVYADDSGDQLDTGAQNLCWDFCIRFLGRPWQTIQGCGPSPEAVAMSLDQLVQRLNQTLRRMGYPANSASWTSGAC